jgi:radical SAM superfamily enzyme YgiQ (UPF0313 family)
MELELFHIGVIGEGEITLSRIVEKYVQTLQIPTDLKGTIVFQNNIIKRNEPRERVKDLDILPTPSMKYLDINLYGPQLAKKPFAYMTTSRGCPYDCAYCYKRVWGKRTALRSAQKVFEEIQQNVKEFNVREIWIWDDTFTINRKRVIDLCKLILSHNLKLRWKVMTRVDRIDEALLRMMKKAGCYRVEFGVESGDQSILDLMKKNITIEQIRKAFSLCKKIGLQTHAFLMIGYPRETKKTMLSTIRLALEIADWASFNAVSVFPGTALYDLAIKENYFKPRSINFFKGQTTHDNFCDSAELPTKEILKQVKQAYLMFYLRPFHIIHLIGLLIRDNQIISFIKIMPYIFQRLFGQYKRVQKN